MLGAADPNLVVGEFAIIALIAAAFWRFLVWIRNSPTKPDPWDAEVQDQLQDAPEICPHCSTPQPTTAWFCEHCGRAVGPYNNLMPFIQVFSEGEVLRNGTHDRMRKSPLIVIGYFLISINFLGLALSLANFSVILSLAFLFGLMSFWAAVYNNIYRRQEGQ